MICCNQDYDYDFAGDNTPRLTKTLETICKKQELYRMLCNNNIDPEFPEKLFSLPLIRQILTDQMGVQEYFFSFIVNGGYSVVRDWINKDERESPQEMAAFLNFTIGKLFQLPEGMSGT